MWRNIVKYWLIPLNVSIQLDTLEQLIPLVLKDCPAFVHGNETKSNAQKDIEHWIHSANHNGLLSESEANCIAGMVVRELRVLYRAD